MSTVELVKLTKKYDPKGDAAVDAVDLTIADGEFVVLVGPSGCGKSTALRMVAGLEDVTDGEIRINGTRVNEVAPQHRDIAMVFQNYALYPHMTVAKNMAYPLKIAGVSADEIKRRVAETAGVLQLEDFLDRKPGQLSGGQRQRVAMGRALIRQPKVFLMDEPLSNLDAKLRVYMRAEIARIQRALGVTTLYVTHDQVEAMTMGDRVVVMKGGVIQQAATPQELYDSPDNVFVAGFIGSPAMNLFAATVHLGASPTLEVGGQTLVLDPSALARRPGLAAYDGMQLVAGVRPEDVHDPAISPEYGSRLAATVSLVEALGSEMVVHLHVGIDRIVSGDPDLDELGTDADQSRHEFVGRFSPRSRVRLGDRMDVGIDTANLHFFDLGSGAAIRD
jgi:multiple sugar transport system ATP-binding protein